MANQETGFLSELAWEFMTPMECAVWGTTVALHFHDDDSGLSAADSAILKLRSVAKVRSRRPEPEAEAARAGDHIEFDDFAIWYPIAYRIAHYRDREYRLPTPKQTEEAYERFAVGRNDFF